LAGVVQELAVVPVGPARGTGRGDGGEGAAAAGGGVPAPGRPPQRRAAARTTRAAPAFCPRTGDLDPGPSDRPAAQEIEGWSRCASTFLSPVHSGRPPPCLQPLQGRRVVGEELFLGWSVAGCNIHFCYMESR